MTLNQNLNNIYGCWYEPGDAGTWLTWFINQHDNFPRFSNTLRYEQENNPLGHIASDYSCWDSDWHVIEWEGHGQQSWTEFVANVKSIYRSSYTNVCYKVLPFHNPFSISDNEVEGYDQHSFADMLVKQSNTNKIIIPIIKSDYELFAKRLAFIRPRFSVETARDIYKHRINRLYNNNITGTQQHADVVIINVDQLIIHCSEEEYQKLCTAIDQPALYNWKELVQNYYKTVYEPWIHIDDAELNNRDETRENSQRGPYL